MAWIVQRVTSKGEVRYSVAWRDRSGRHRSLPLGHGDRLLAEAERQRIAAVEEGHATPEAEAAELEAVMRGIPENERRALVPILADPAERRAWIAGYAARRSVTPAGPSR